MAANNVDIGNVLNAVGATGATGATTSSSGGSPQGQLLDAFGQQKAAIQDEISATLQAGANKAIVDGQEDIGKLTAQNNMRKAATALGTNMDDTSQIVTQIGSTMRNTALALDNQTKVVAKLDANSSLFGNPLGFIYNLLYGGEERDKLSSLETQMDVATKSLQDINRATQQTAVTQNAIAQTKTEASIAANQQMILDNARVAADQAKTRLAGVDINAINNIAQLNAQQISLANQAHSMKIQDQRFAWEKADRAAADASDKDQMDAWNRFAPTVGLPTVSTIAALKSNINMVGKDKAQHIISSGYMEGQGITPPIGPTPATSLLRLAQFPNTQLPPAQKVVVEDLKQLASASTNVSSVSQMLIDTNQVPKSSNGINQTVLASQQAATLMKDKTPAGRIALQDQMISWGLSKQAANPTAINNGALNVPPINVLKNAPYMEQNKFLADYIKPLVDAGGASIKFDLTNMTNTIQQANMSGNISTAEITKGITWMANQLLANNNMSKGFERFGIPTPTRLPMNVSVKSSGFVSGFNSDIDATDPAAVNTFVVRSISTLNKLQSTEQQREIRMRNTEQRLHLAPAD